MESFWQNCFPEVFGKTLAMQQQFYSSPDRVWLERSHWLFPCGWYGVEVLKEMP